MNIPVFKPLIDKKTINAAVKSLNIGWLGMGKSVDEFEKKIKSICNLKDRHVVTVNTGYSAIHTALILMNIGKNDEVITPAFNNIADLQSILSVGGKIVFADIDKSLCLDPLKLEKLITKKTKAIIVCDYGMNIANHDKIKIIAKLEARRKELDNYIIFLKLPKCSTWHAIPNKTSPLPLPVTSPPLPPPPPRRT